MATIGLLGGTFNPIHNAHIHMGLSAMESLKLDKIIYIPAGNPPHKEAVGTSGGDRLEMARLAVSEYEGFEVSDYEIKKETYCYSVETVGYFKENYPEDDFVFIVGEDSLNYIDKWYKPEVLLSLCRFAVIGRGGYESDIEEKIKALKEKFGAQVMYVKAKEMCVSSSEIRKKLLNGENADNLVPEKVLDYIKENNLYS